VIYVSLDRKECVRSVDIISATPPSNLRSKASQALRTIVKEYPWSRYLGFKMLKIDPARKLNAAQNASAVAAAPLCALLVPGLLRYREDFL